MRLFIAIPLPPSVTDQLSAVRSALERPQDGLRWSSPESWHITLQFLGNTSVTQLECVVKALRKLRATPVPIHLEGLGFFERAGVFFADVHVTPGLGRLQQQVTEATRPCGFEPELRPYHPHITLARNKGRSDGVRALKPRVAAAPQFAQFSTEEFLLYESFPRPSGSQYVIRERFAFTEDALSAP